MRYKLFRKYLTQEEIINVIKRCKTEESPGRNRIEMEMKKYEGKPIVKMIVTIFNTCI